MITLILLSTFAKASDVSLRLPAQPVSKALEIVGREVGRELYATQALADQILVLRVSHVSSDTLLQEIADFFDAKWVEKSGHRFYLQPDPAREFARKSEEANRGASALQTAIQSALQTKLRGTSSERGIEGVLRKFLTECPKGRLYELFKPESQTWALSDGEDTLPAEVRKLLHDAANSLQQRTHESCLDAEFTIEPFEHGLFCQIAVRGEDESGDIASVEISPKTRIWGTTKPERLDALPKIVPSATTLDIVRADGRLRRLDSESLEARRKVQPILTDPARYEPLSFEASDVILQIADALDENLLASPPEYGRCLFESDQFARSVRVGYELFFSPNRKDQNGWWRLFPPGSSARLSRPATRNFLRSSAERQGVTVDSAADLLATLPEDQALYGWPMTYTRILLPYIGNLAPHLILSQTDKLRLWHSLGADARAQLVRGQNLEMSRLSSQAAWQFFKIIKAMPLDRTRWKAPLSEQLRRATVRMKVDEETIFVGWSTKPGVNTG